MRSIRMRELPELVGTELGLSSWLTIEQDMVDRFASLTGDNQWIHVDVERATREIGGPIAHGFLVLSLFSRLSVQIHDVNDATACLNYGFDKIRFVRPVPVGSQVRLRQTITEVRRKEQGVMVTLSCELQLAGSDRPAVVADWLALYQG